MYSQVRQEIIDAVKMDLMGPREEAEVLTENPRSAYIIGMLAPQTRLDGDTTSNNEQEVDFDIEYDDSADYTAGEDDDNEPISHSNFKIPSSIGISFYVESSVSSINIDVSWADYDKSVESKMTKDDKEKKTYRYTRLPIAETIVVRFGDFAKGNDYQLANDSNVVLHVTRIALKNGYSFVTAYVVNKRTTPDSEIESFMFQVNIKAYSQNDDYIFISEDICRKIVASDEYYFKQRPIFGRGRGCSAIWGECKDGRTQYVESCYIPEYEFPGVSAALIGFDQFYFSMRTLSKEKQKDEIIKRLNVLADSYENWINNTLRKYPDMADSVFKEKIGDATIAECETALKRIRNGISLLCNDSIAFDSFCFMNSAMIYQRNISNYAKAHGDGVECSFTDFIDPRNPENDFGWRPFQIAFILMNLCAITDPNHEDREIVDLLYFPTGGGKTEAYLGLMAFVIANRRLRASNNSYYNRDGGVTAILRYTLRLLTTQQRDRITKMVIAAELIRKKQYPKYGKEPISIGFWVGGKVTPNDFESMKEDPEDPEATKKARAQKRLVYKQLLTCPFCGKSLSKRKNGNKDEDITDLTFNIDIKRKSIDIYCLDKNCLFYKYDDEKNKIPVYLVDEEIYAKCPTIILSTVDKFARLPWDEKTNALFGRVDRKCSRDGYIAIGNKHPERHNKTETLPAASTIGIKPFLPPELIIQDELHLITGPLGTVYGAYETLIEDLCSYKVDGKTIKPKYVVSTATIRNAKEQAKCLYARNNTSQFPPNGFEIGDSFFIRELSVKENPFRKYIGVCAPGQSVKTTLLRTYSIILQKAFDLSLQDEYKDYIDPYYTLVGYYNSIRELGGAARLLQDDIPDRIKRLKKKYGMEKQRYLNHKEEITSRMSSYEIPNKLQQLTYPYDSKGCLDTAIATNMIAVGMDVDRLGLMVVTGQPKQNSEYIQATSRIGRTYPGMVVTVYNPYRPRDLSHYENFTGYHSQLYRFVEGTTATPFSERARDRVLYALIIAALRLKCPDMATNDDAVNINSISAHDIDLVKNMILERLNIIKPIAKQEAENEIDVFIDNWKFLASRDKPLKYYVWGTEKNNRLMNTYGEYCTDQEIPVLRSMRDVESSANMYYYGED